MPWRHSPAAWRGSDHVHDIRLPRLRPLRRARRGVRRALSPGRAAELAGVRRPAPRDGRGDPRDVPGHGRGRAGRRRRPGRDGPAVAAGLPARRPDRRLPDPARGRPGRDGRGLRGRADLARPAGRPEGPPRPRDGRPPGPGAVPPRGEVGGAAAPHQHRAGLRGRPRSRRQLLRHAADPGPGARPGLRGTPTAPRARSEGERARPCPIRRPGGGRDRRPAPGRRDLDPAEACPGPDDREAPDRPAGGRGTGRARRRRDDRDRPGTDRTIRPRRDLGTRGRTPRDANPRRPRTRRAPRPRR